MIKMADLSKMVDQTTFNPNKLYLIIKQPDRHLALNLTERYVRRFKRLGWTGVFNVIETVEKTLGEVIRIDVNEPLELIDGRQARLGKLVVYLPKGTTNENAF